jgi:hypothetical protein
VDFTEHQLRAKIAAEHSKRDPNPVRIAELREQQREALLVGWIERQLATAPPLNQATRDRLAALLASPSEPHADKSAHRACEAA